MDNIVISVSSLDLLKKILKGDENVEISIRNKVMDEISSKYLNPVIKDVLQSETIKINNNIRKSCRELLDKELKESKLEIYLNQLVQKVISNIINNSDIDKIIDAKIKASIEKKLKNIRL